MTRVDRFLKMYRYYKCNYRLEHFVLAFIVCHYSSFVNFPMMQDGNPTRDKCLLLQYVYAEL